MLSTYFYYFNRSENYDKTEEVITEKVRQIMQQTIIINRCKFQSKMVARHHCYYNF